MKLCIFGNKTSTKELLVELLKSQVEITNLVTLSLDNAKGEKIAGQDGGLIEFSVNHGILTLSIIGAQR